MVFASTVRFTTNTAFRGWVVKWIFVSLTSGFHPLGCCLFVVLVVLARGLHPVSFPNLEVKPFCADGTATGGLWESRALPTVSLSGGGVDPDWSGLTPPPPFYALKHVQPIRLTFDRHGIVRRCSLYPQIGRRYQPEPGVVVGKERTNHLGIFAHTAPHLPNTLMAWTKAQASAESYLKL